MEYKEEAEVLADEAELAVQQLGVELVLHIEPAPQ